LESKSSDLDSSPISNSNPKGNYFRSYYHPGGTLPKESPTYVTRQADQEFYDGLVKGEFCYVLNARQMGKSSLQVRTWQRLEKDGVACAVVDLTKIGGNASEEAFYDCR